MKTSFVHSIKELFTNRYLTVLCGVVLALAISLLIYIIATVRPSDLQLVTHYSAFGVTHLYRDQWFYLLSFGVFALLVAIFHIGLAVKLYVTKGHPIAIMMTWMGVGILVFAWIVALSIINVWSPV